MTGTASLSAGALIGLSVAAPIGPMGLLCIKRTLTHGMLVGISTGAGATTVQLIYCGLLLLGLDEIGPFLAGHRQGLGLLGGSAMLLFAWRVARVRKGLPSRRRAAVGSLLIAYVTAAMFNFTNPMAVLLLMAATAAVVGGASPTGAESGLLLLGLLAGSASWWVALSGMTALLRRQLTGRVLALMNQVAAAGLASFGLVTLARAVLA